MSSALIRRYVTLALVTLVFVGCFAALGAAFLSNRSSEQRQNLLRRQITQSKTPVTVKYSNDLYTVISYSLVNKEVGLKLSNGTILYVPESRIRLF